MTGANLHIVGLPKASFPFVGLPSVNTHYNQHYRLRGIHTAEWRNWANEDASLFLWQNPELPRPLVSRALVVVNVYPPYEEISDIHNIHIKPILDGFTDAGIWVDDEWAFCPIVMFRWAGIGEQKPRQHKIRRTVIDIYELYSVTIAGEIQRLPKGRIWLNQH
jgi:hypothetical protein